MQDFCDELLTYLGNVGSSLLGSRCSIFKKKLNEYKNMSFETEVSRRAGVVLLCEIAYEIHRVGHQLPPHITARLLLCEKNYYTEAYVRSLES